MTPIAAYPPPASVHHDTDRIALHDHVASPDGRAGSVIGFYRSEEESVLVLFGAGDSHRFLPSQLERLV